MLFSENPDRVVSDTLAPWRVAEIAKRCSACASRGGPQWGISGAFNAQAGRELRKTLITIAAARHTVRIESQEQSLLSLRGSQEIPKGKETHLYKGQTNAMRKI